ncbi:hypothetical protein PsorP6_006129 [Peronosclerospora sorghi]|uniref:Uncharacterized protein n=1 Tax=Peronosclerospora sorghi TaxID=230839 RepID=A0ACC0W3R0_9STRA|nr:hypothetical protein PsorP6_006129 [Peronosclerospora sorghi]
MIFQGKEKPTTTFEQEEESGLHLKEPRAIATTSRRLEDQVVSVKRQAALFVRSLARSLSPILHHLSILWLEPHYHVSYRVSSK